MSRTYRNLEGSHPYVIRCPKTANEIKSLKGLIHDEHYDDELEEYHISGMNRAHKRLNLVPTAWDDQVISAYYEEDHHKE